MSKDQPLDTLNSCGKKRRKTLLRFNWNCLIEERIKLSIILDYSLHLDGSHLYRKQLVMQTSNNSLILPIVVALFLTACTTLTGARSPSSQDNSSAVTPDDLRAKYYISTFPADNRGEFSIELTDIKVFSDQCRAGEFGDWMSPTTSVELQRKKENILSMKLNRPFYFQTIKGQDKKMHFVGSMTDFNLFVCISLALNEGQTISQTTKLSQNFFDATSKMPRINFQVLQLLIGEWKKTSFDLKSGISIIQSSAFDYYQATDIVGSVFKQNLRPDDRVKLVQAIVGTHTFSAHSFDLSQSIIRESNNFVTPEERAKIIEVLLTSDKSVDKTAILNYLISNVQAGADYTSNFQRLIAGTTPEFKFDAFSSILNSGGKIQNPEQTFLKIWTTRGVGSAADSMISFAIDNWEKQLWLSHQTVVSVMSECLTQKVAPMTLDKVIHFLTFTKGEDLKVMVVFLDLIRKNQELNSTRTTNAINAAYVIRGRAPTTETQLTPIVLQIRDPFSSSPEVNEAFFRYITWMNDLNKKIAVVESLMKSENINESLLISVAQGAYSIKLDNRITLLAEIIKQKTITDLGLGAMVGLLSSNPFKISDAEKSILLQIKANPKASTATLQKIDKVLNPSWEIIQDPDKK